MRLCLLLGLLLLLGACKTMQPVAHDDLSRLQGQVERGDRVEVVTTDGRTLRFTVTEVTADALVGGDVAADARLLFRLFRFDLTTERSASLDAWGRATFAQLNGPAALVAAGR